MIDQTYNMWFSIETLIQTTIFLLVSLIYNFLLNLPQDKYVLHLHKQCYIAEKLLKLLSLNFDKVTIAVAVFGILVSS